MSFDDEMIALRREITALKTAQRKGAGTLKTVSYALDLDFDVELDPMTMTTPVVYYGYLVTAVADDGKNMLAQMMVSDDSTNTFFPLNRVSEEDGGVQTWFVAPRTLDFGYEVGDSFTETFTITSTSEVSVTVVDNVVSPYAYFEDDL